MDPNEDFHLGPQLTIRAPGKLKLPEGSEWKRREERSGGDMEIRNRERCYHLLSGAAAPALVHGWWHWQILGLGSRWELPLHQEGGGSAADASSRYCVRAPEHAGSFHSWPAIHWLWKKPCLGPQLMPDISGWKQSCLPTQHLAVAEAAGCPWGRSSELEEENKMSKIQDLTLPLYPFFSLSKNSSRVILCNQQFPWRFFFFFLVSIPTI